MVTDEVIDGADTGITGRYGGRSLMFSSFETHCPGNKMWWWGSQALSFQRVLVHSLLQHSHMDKPVVYPSPRSGGESQHLGSLSSHPTSTFYLSPLPVTPSNCLFYPLACPSPAEDWKQQLSEDCWESTWMRIRKLILWLPRFPHVLRPVCHGSCMTESL